MSFSFSGFHNHSSDAEYINKTGNRSSLLLKDTRLDENVKEKLLNYFIRAIHQLKLWKN